MPEAVEAKKKHFFYGLFGRPMIRGHAIRSNENAGAVVAEAAVDKDLLVMILEERKKLRDLLIRRGSPAADRNIYEAHAERFGLLAFPLNQIAIVAAEIHDRGDAEFLEFLDSLGMGLRAAKERIVNFSSVVDAGELQFFAKRKRRNRG